MDDAKPNRFQIVSSYLVTRVHAIRHTTLMCGRLNLSNLWCSLKLLPQVYTCRNGDRDVRESRKFTVRSFPSLQKVVGKDRLITIEVI